MSNQKRISFGYTRNALKEIVIYKEQAEVVKLIRLPDHFCNFFHMMRTHVIHDNYIAIMQCWNHLAISL